MKPELLLEHHLHFLSLHRGRRESMPGLELIHSEKAAFNLAFLLEPEALERAPAGFQVYLPDWSAAGMETLTQAGWTQTAEVVYKTLDGNPAGWQGNPDLRVRQAGTQGHIDRFSLVQARGFCETEELFQEWHPWMRQKNRLNATDPDQRFYVGSLNGSPAGVSLAMDHRGVAGIYAVTTLPAGRHQGVSTGLMRRLVSDARQRNVTAVTLQVFAGSYAEGFYRKLGFGKVFSCKVFRRLEGGGA